MLVAIFGDIHGNLIALEQFFKDTIHVDKYICLGDVVNYGPWSNECVQLINTKNNIITLKGNHEESFLSKSYSGTNIIARSFFDFCIEEFTEDIIISSYIDSYQFMNYDFRHTVNDSYIFKDSPLKIDRNIVLGHSHQQFQRVINGFKVINPGSLGQNRALINQAEYLIFNSEQDTFECRKFIFDCQVMIDEMKKRKYPDICVNYYQQKPFK